MTFSRDGNTLFVSDESTKYSIVGTGVTDDLWEGRPYGRIVRIDMATRTTTVLATGLYFANGVYLTQDEKALIFSETYAGRLSKLDLATLRVSPFMGTHLIDNLTPAGDGRFWAAVVAKHDPKVDAIMASPLLRRLMRKLPLPASPYSAGLLFNEQGEIVRAFEDAKGSLLDRTSVYASYRNRLYVGSYSDHGIITCPFAA